MKATLSNAIILQLAAGAAIASLDFTVAAATADGTVPDAEAQQLLRAQAIELEAGFKAAGSTAVTTAVTAATTPLNTRITELTASLATANTELTALRTTSAALTTQTQTLEASVASCEKVLSNAINCMQVALGGKETEITLKGAELVAEHARVEVEFLKKFPNAKVSVSAADPEKKVPVTSGALPDFAVIASRQNALRNGAKA